MEERSVKTEAKTRIVTFDTNLNNSGVILALGLVDFLRLADALFLLLVGRGLEARLEAALPRNFDNPRRRNNHLTK